MIVLIVNMTVKPGTEQECIRLCRQMTEESLKEPGCTQYAVSQSTENPRHFVIFEEYVDELALRLHRDSPHFDRFITGGVDALVESRTRELFLPVS